MTQYFAEQSSTGGSIGLPALVEIAIRRLSECDSPEEWVAVMTSVVDGACAAGLVEGLGRASRMTHEEIVAELKEQMRKINAAKDRQQLHKQFGVKLNKKDIP